MEATAKVINKYYVRIDSVNMKFFTEEEYEQALECAKEHSTYVRLV